MPVGFYDSVFASSISNFIGTLVAHPLDTIKVRMQVNTHQSQRVSKVLAHTLYNEGFSGLYKGVTQPIISSVPVASLVFLIKDWMTTWFLNLQLSDNMASIGAGATAGCASLIITVPSELLKCRA